MAADEYGIVHLDRVGPYIDLLTELGDNVIVETSIDVCPELDTYIPLANEESKIELFKKLSICINICNERVFNGRSENFFTEAA